MTQKVYAVYSIPKSPEYKLEKLFKTKEAAKEYVKKSKEDYGKGLFQIKGYGPIFDIQLEEIEE